MAKSVEEAKRTAARQAVDEYVKDGYVVGVGSGSTVVYAAERLGELVREKNFHIKCIPTSFQASQLIAQHHLHLTSLEENPVIDVTIDGADEVDTALNCIKGGGGCHLQEKIVAFASRVLVLVADYRKESQHLGEKWLTGVPVEVVPMAHVPVMERLRQFGGTPVLRMSQDKAGPVVSDNGNFIVDAKFGLITEPAALNARINLLPGVVEVGLFCSMATKVFFGQEDGSITTRVANPAPVSPWANP